MKARDFDPRTQLALATYVKLLRAAQTVHSHATRGLAEHELTPGQFAVLEALYHVGPLCLSDLARKVLMTGGNITMVVSNLAKRGLVRRVVGKQDRRYVTAEITAAGTRLMKAIFPAHAETIARLLDPLGQREQEVLGDLCRKLGTSVASGS